MDTAVSVNPFKKSRLGDGESAESIEALLRFAEGAERELLDMLRMIEVAPVPGANIPQLQALEKFEPACKLNKLELRRRLGNGPLRIGPMPKDDAELAILMQLKPAGLNCRIDHLTEQEKADIR